MIIVKNRLNAGFFSNFNAVLGWYWFHMRTDIPIHVMWDGLPGENIFNRFFTQKFEYSTPLFESNGNVQHSHVFSEDLQSAFKEDIGDELYDKYNGWFMCRGSLYTEPTFQKLRDLYNHIYLSNLTPKYSFPNIVPENTLGVNYRYINMYLTEGGIPFSQRMTTEAYHNLYLNEIEERYESGKFDKIYVACSHKMFFDICESKFKDKLLYIPMERLKENLWEIHRNSPLTEEFANVLHDVHNLTQCSDLLISPSNIIFSTLMFNPNVPFTVFKFLKDAHTL